MRLARPRPLFLHNGYSEVARLFTEYRRILRLWVGGGFLARFIFDIQECVLALVQRLHQGRYLEFLLTGGSGHRGEGNPNGFLFASSGAYLWATLCVMRHDGMTACVLDTA